MNFRKILMMGVAASVVVASAVIPSQAEDQTTIALVYGIKGDADIEAAKARAEGKAASR